VSQDRGRQIKLSLVDLAKGLSHPVRLAIVNQMRLCDGTSSPKELAAQLSLPLGRVSYHVRTLRALGLLELVETIPRRGTVEHRYLLTPQVRPVLAKLL
jgi:DNA-binding transcriptional ArsR family regulator